MADHPHAAVEDGNHVIMLMESVGPECRKCGVGMAHLCSPVSGASPAPVVRVGFKVVGWNPLMAPFACLVSDAGCWP